MNKLLLALILSFTSVSLMAQSIVEELETVCRNGGGNVKTEPYGTPNVKDGECFKILCVKSSNVGSVDFSKSVDQLYSELSPKGAGLVTINNKCRAWSDPTKDPSLQPKPQPQPPVQSGTASGVQSGVASGAQSGVQSGIQSGGQNGNTSTVGNTSTSTNGGIYLDFCKLTLFPGDACYKVCTKRGFPIIGKKGVDRKDCQECIGLNFKSAVIDSKGRTKGATQLSINCAASGLVRDANGNCVDANGNAPGSRNNGNANGSAAGAGGGGGVIIGGGNGNGPGPGGLNGSGTINVTVSGSGTGAVEELPAFCKSDTRKDKKRCLEWRRLGGGRFSSSSRSSSRDCSYSTSEADCMGDDLHVIRNRYESEGDCVNCRRQQKSGAVLEGIASIAGAIAPAAASVLGSYFQYRGQKAWATSYENSQKGWAAAQEKGFEQCRLQNSEYLQYLQTDELPALTPEQQAAMGCNGYQVNQYAGTTGNNGYYNGMIGGGYTPGYVGGMIGQYGGYNPYGGMMNGGMVTGVSLSGGYSGGYVQGGYVQGGYAQGGYVQGGYVQGGYSGGYIQGGGYLQGGGYIQGGGYSAGYTGGYVNGVSLSGGYSGGYIQGGYAAQGGYAQGGYIQGGYAQGGYAQGGGYVQGGGYSGGYNPYAGTGQYSGGYYGQQNNSMYYAQSSQAASRDQMLQSQGIAYQMGMGSGQNMYGGNSMYGASASMYPSNFNAGFSMNGYSGY